MLVLLITLSSVARANPATIFSDGFESGDFSAWTGTYGSITVSTDRANSATYSAKFTGSSYAYEYLASAYSTLYMRMYVYFSSLPNSGYQTELQGTSYNDAFFDYAMFVAIHNDGAGGPNYWGLYNGYTDVSQWSTTEVNTGQWYCVELKAVRNGTCTLYIDSVDLGLNLTAADHADWSAVQTSDLNFGCTAYFDDVVVSDSYIGPVAYQVTFDQTGLSPDFPGTVVTVDGVNYSFTQLPVSFLWNEGSTHTFAFQSPLVVPARVIQYLWNSTSGGLSESQSATLTISGPGSVVGNYVAQYFVGGEIINTPTLFNYLILAAFATVAVTGVASLLRKLPSSRFPKRTRALPTDKNI